MADMSTSWIYVEEIYNGTAKLCIHELETLAILEALIKWEDKLIGYDICIITDHKALEFFKMQSSLTVQQCRWMLFVKV